jgi:hypothetical protein
MSKLTNKREKVAKQTCQNGSKTSTLNKARKDTKQYRGQGK